MQAAKLNLTGNLHVWFTPVWDELDQKENYNCTNEEIKAARAHSFGVLGSDLVEERSSQTMLVSAKVGETKWWTAHRVCYMWSVCIILCVCVCAVLLPPDSQGVL